MSKRKIYDRERKEDYISIYKKRILNNIIPILNHAATIYTKNIFDQFRHEFDEICRYKVSLEHDDNIWQIFHVTSKFGKHEEFQVKVNFVGEVGEYLDCSEVVEHFQIEVYLWFTK